ncbi:MAG: MBL fold metallo-hydrolase [Dehalococcoidia bacterium]|nr:MBL fold metallo-hydrolase [Dehalococcoidia bacterium]
MANDKVTIGNVEITSFTDGNLEMDLCDFFPSIPNENWNPYENYLTPEHGVRFNLGSFLIRSDGRTILVDTGMGGKPADAPETPWRELLDNLKAGGVSPEDIDMVVMTHLHRDHVGWNLLSRGGKYEPTFPKAHYWVSAGDWEFFSRPENLDLFDTTRTCVLPLKEMGIMELMDGEHALTSELTTLPTPGHTPGHMSIMVSSQGERGLIMGDAAHNQAQVHETDWCSRADIDHEQTRITRRALMERLEREGIVVASGHFPAPGFGRVVRLEGRRCWQGL